MHGLVTLLLAAEAVDARESPTVQLPAANEWFFGLLSFGLLLVPVLLFAFVLWQVVRTRQAAERAADAAERAAGS